MVGGLRSGMGYVGAHNLEELREEYAVCAYSGARPESHPHDVQITKKHHIQFHKYKKLLTEGFWISSNSDNSCAGQA